MLRVIGHPQMASSSAGEGLLRCHRECADGGRKRRIFTALASNKAKPEQRWRAAGRIRRQRFGARIATGLLLGAALSQPAAAFRIELKDVAPDRIERQRAEAIGLIPFPGTPNIAQFDERLKEKGLALGAPMFIRVFKAENELEVWLRKGDRFELFATYPICHWSGTLGPKISEGDKQAPEGIYTVTWRQLHMVGRHPRSLNLGFPNLFDRQYQRTGSYILIHGGCGSVGCFAMTNPVIDEIFKIAQAAIKGGQDAIHVHAFPFRLTEQKLRAYALHEWYDFWRNLKDVHDQFEATRRVPKVVVCEGRYWVDPDDGEVASQSPLAVCGAPQVAASQNSPTAIAPSQIGSSSPLSPRPLPGQRQSGPQAPSWVTPVLPRAPRNDLASSRLPVATSAPAATSRLRSSRSESPIARLTEGAARQPGSAAPAAGTSAPGTLTRALATAREQSITPIATCQTTLASCRRWLARQQAMATMPRRVAIAPHGRTAATAPGAPPSGLRR